MRQLLPTILILASCSGDVSAPDPAHLQSLSLDLESVVLDAVGSSRTITSRTLDQHGQPMSVQISWASSDSSVATVVEGSVAARSNGVAQVTASSGRLSATAFVSVRDTTTVRVAGVWKFKASLGNCEYEDILLRVDQSGRTLRGIWSGTSVTNLNRITPWFSWTCRTVESGRNITSIYGDVGRGSLVGEVRADTVLFTITADTIKASYFTSMSSVARLRNDTITGRSNATGGIHGGTTLNLRAIR